MILDVCREICVVLFIFSMFVVVVVCFQFHFFEKGEKKKKKERMDEPHQSNMIKLISAEGHEFIVNRKCAMVSGTIKAMLSG